MRAAFSVLHCIFLVAKSMSIVGRFISRLFVILLLGYMSFRCTLYPSPLFEARHRSEPVDVAQLVDHFPIMQRL